MSHWSQNRSSNGATPTTSRAHIGTDAGAAVGISAEGLTKDYPGTPALRGVDLAVAPGELVALLGPSGSGKTTLLRIIAGLEWPSEGRILFGNEDATRMSVQARRVGFVFQSYALFKHLTVGANIAYGLKVRPRSTRPDAAAVRQRVADLLELVQLPGLERRYPSQLSGGQRQRVALARALAVDPKVLLLDEPFGALDAQVRRDLRRWLREIHDRTGHTTLFVTHDQDEALELADRVAVLNQGRVEQVGTPDEIYDRPATAFVAGFVGEAVRLPVTTDGETMRIGSHRVAMPLGAKGVEGPAELFVRPRDLVLAAPGTPGSLPAVVLAVRRAGPGRRAELLLSPGIAPVEIELPPDSPIAQGDNRAVAFVQARIFPQPT